MITVLLYKWILSSKSFAFDWIGCIVVFRLYIPKPLFFQSASVNKAEGGNCRIETALSPDDSRIQLSVLRKKIFPRLFFTIE